MYTKCITVISKAKLNKVFVFNFSNANQGKKGPTFMAGVPGVHLHSANKSFYLQKKVQKICGWRR